MLLRDVGDFMGQHPGQFGFRLCRQDEAAMHADITARQGKGIQRGVADGEKLEIPSRLWRRRREAGAKRVEIGRHLDIVDIARLP